MINFKTFTKSYYNQGEWQNLVNRVSEAKELNKDIDEHQFAIELVSEIDDAIGSINGEISKDLRNGKTNSKKLGIQIEMKDSKRIAFASMANEIISKDSLLEPVKPASDRVKKDFAFKHKDMMKYVYVQTRPDGKRGGGATADPNELMTACLCTMSSIPNIETLEDLDLLIEEVKKIVKSGKVIGFTSLEVESLEKDYGNLCQAVSAAQAIQKNYGIGAEKVYMTGKSWDSAVQQFQVTKYGMKDYNASDFILKKSDSFLGVSLKKKLSATTADPTLINKGFTTMLQGSEFDKVRKDLDDAAGVFYTAVIKTTYRFQKRDTRGFTIKPKRAIDKDGNPLLDDTMIKDLGPNARNVSKSNWKPFVERIPNDIINKQLKKSKSLFKPMSDVIIKNSDLFGNQLLQLIFKMDLQDLQKLNFDYALVTGIGRFLVKGPVIESGEYKDVNTMVGALDKLYSSGKVRMVLDVTKTQAFERGSTAAMLFFKLFVGATPISDITLRYKGNFKAAPNFLATATKEFKGLLKR